MNRTLLVTGATRGIGREIAITFAKNGYNIAFCYKSSDEKAKSLSDELSALGISVYCEKFDVSNLSQITDFTQRVVNRFGKIDVLVNNAGVANSKLLIDTTDDEVLNIINTNLNSCIIFSREVAKSMIKNGSGKIINISSIWGNSGASMETVYSASKAGIIGFTQGLSKELGLMGINVNAIAPGVIMTDMNRGYSDDELNELKDNTSLGRLGEAHDIANVALFLASENASYITGQCITVDGGFV